MKPYLEKLPHADDASWSMLYRPLEDGIPFQWHHHPEYELTLTLNSRGQRFIGDHVGSYDDGDLVLVGPNLPHTWFSTQRPDPGQPHLALVFWFSQAWIDRFTGELVEFRPVARLIERAGGGLKFSSEMSTVLRDRYRAVFAERPAERVLSLLAILLRLASDDTAEPLAAALSHAAPGESRERIDRVLTHIHQAYHEPLALDDLASLAALSVSGLHRMFVKHTQRTISAYVLQLRIGDACARLSATGQPIQHIAGEVGYTSLANFNRHFRRLKGMTPRAYRALFQPKL